MSQIPNRLPLISLCLQNSHLVTGYLWRLSGFLKNWSMLARSPSSHTENPVHPRDSSAGNSLLISMNRQQNISAKSSFYEFHSWLPSSVEKPLFASWNAIGFGPRHDSQTWKKIIRVSFFLYLFWIVLEQLYNLLPLDSCRDLGFLVGHAMESVAHEAPETLCLFLLWIMGLFFSLPI